MTHLTEEELELAAKGGAAPAHLSSCPECRAQVARARARQQLLGGLKRYTLSDDAFRRSEARVLAAARESRASFGWRLWLPLALAAAAAVALFVARPEPVKPAAPELAEAPKPPLPAVKEAAPRAWPALTVALAAQAERRVGEGWAPLRAGEVLEQATEVRAARLVLTGGALALDGAPVTLLGKDALAEVDAAGARLDLDGRAEAVVRVGPRWFKSTDAAYLASRAAAAVDLELRRGEVWVADDASFARAVRVAAPARLRFSDGAASGEALPGAPAEAPAFRPATGARFELSPRFPLGDRVALGDASLGGAPLSMLLPPGRHRLRFFQGERLVGERFVLAQGDSAALEEPKVQAPRLPVMPPEEQERLMALAINAQKGQLSGCYEKWLKNDGRAGGSFSVAVVVSERGKVKSASVKGALPDAVAECVRRTATGFKFPAAGEEVELEIPVKMTRP